MKRVIAVLICFVLAILIVKFVPTPEIIKSHYKAEIVETLETQNTPFRIRINKHIERGGFMAALNGAYYVFQSAASGSDQWQDITTYRFDDPIDIPRNQVRFANEQVGYVFMFDMYAVTQDGGASWKISDIDNYLPKDEKCGSIEDLRIDANGVGEVKLKCYAKKDSFKVLETTDFGRRWREK